MNNIMDTLAEMTVSDVINDARLHMNDYEQFDPVIFYIRVAKMLLDEADNCAQ